MTRLTGLAVAVSGLPAALGAAGFAFAGLHDWALGLLAGWTAGSVNTGLLALRVRNLGARSSVASFLYGTASRFALVAVAAIGTYRWLGASLPAFSLGIALVLLLGIPVTALVTLRGQPA